MKINRLITLIDQILTNREIDRHEFYLKTSLLNRAGAKKLLRNIYRIFKIQLTKFIRLVFVYIIACLSIFFHIRRHTRTIS